MLVAQADGQHGTGWRHGNRRFRQFIELLVELLGGCAVGAVRLRSRRCIGGSRVIDDGFIDLDVGLGISILLVVSQRLQLIGREAVWIRSRLRVVQQHFIKYLGLGLGLRFWLGQRRQVDDAAFGQPSGQIPQFVGTVQARWGNPGIAIPVAQPGQHAAHSRAQAPGDQAGDDDQQHQTPDQTLHQIGRRRGEGRFRQAQVQLADEFVLKMHGGDEFALTGCQVVGRWLASGLGDDAVAVRHAQAGMRNQWALRPLGEDDVQAQGVVGRQRIGHQGGDLSGQLAAGPVCLGGDIALQLDLAEPEHQYEHQHQW